MFKIACHIVTSVLCTTGAALGAAVVLDSFEVDEGHFTTPPSFSGSTQGETETAPGVGPSTADRDTTEANTGGASQKLFLDDDPNVATPDGPWRLRHLSGGGTIAANVPLLATGYVGYFFKTLTPNLEASLMIDDSSTALERARFQPIPADGLWHLYQWNLADEADWEAFALADANGVIDNPTVTLDSLYFISRFDFNLPDQDATMFVDDVAFNADGPIPDIIPEPGTVVLGIAGSVMLGLRRRRVSLAAARDRL